MTPQPPQHALLHAARDGRDVAHRRSTTLVKDGGAVRRLARENAVGRDHVVVHEALQRRAEPLHDVAAQPGDPTQVAPNGEATRGIIGGER
jgi:hypothetical protein